MANSSGWPPSLQPPPSRRVVATLMFGAVALLPHTARGLEQICRAIGIGHGPGYHANGCPWCPGQGKCAPGVMCQPQGAWSGYPGIAPGGYPTAGYATGPMGGGYGYEAMPYRSRAAEPVPTPAAGEHHPSPAEPHPADIELAPGEVLLEPPRNIENGHARQLPQMRTSGSMSRPAANTDRSPAAGYGAPAAPRASLGQPSARTYGGYAIGYAPGPTTVARQSQHLRPPVPPTDDYDDEDEPIVASRPLPQREWGKIRSTGPVVSAPIEFDRSGRDAEDD